MKSNMKIPRFWAKKNIDESGSFWWLPLIQHLQDTMDIAGLLYDQWLSQGQRNVIAKSMAIYDDEHVRNTVRFLGGIHDLGKATPVFQTRPGYQNSYDLDYALLDKLNADGFEGIFNVSKELQNSKATTHGLAGEVLLRLFKVNASIASIVGSHHGMPSAENVENQYRVYPGNYYQVQDELNLVHKKWDDSQRAIFDWVLDQSGIESVSNIHGIKQPGQVLLTGLLIMADWIASNEDYFPLLPIDVDAINEELRTQIGWLAWCKSVSLPQESKLGSDIELLYKNRFGFRPHDMQLKVAQVISDINTPGIIIIEAPMGLGKTEMALCAVEQLSQQGQKNGMYFGLPSQATSDGLFPRINTWLNSIVMEQQSNSGLRLLHGKAALNEDFTSLAKGSHFDYENEGNVVINEWFSGRKTRVLDDYIVGTVDQILMMSLKQRHVMLRHLGFSKKVVVIDEVHAYDAYMNEYLIRSLRWLGSYDVPVVILSATLPTATRESLIEEYYRGHEGWKWRDRTDYRDEEASDNYPMITYSDDRHIKQFSDFDAIENVDVSINYLDDSDLVEQITRLLENGGVAGIIVNTVRRAQMIAKQFENVLNDDEVDLFHSGFIATERIKKEKQLLREIGKNGERPNRKVIIGTQVLEQSLDIDFDVIVSDLSPMDLLLQRVGRLHRHKLNERPTNLEKPALWILGASDTYDFESGSEAIYSKYLLMRTQALLPEAIRIPYDISRLVQSVYSDSTILVDEEYTVLYGQAKDEYSQIVKQKKDASKGFMIDKPDYKATLSGWLNSAGKEQSEERSVARVRDSSDTIEVILVQKYAEGYSLFGEKSVLDPTNPNDAKRMAQSTIRLPYVVSAPYNIDSTIDCLESLNLRFFGIWQEQVWLKGALGVLLDEDGCFEINGWVMKYSQKIGLSYEKEEI